MSFSLNGGTIFIKESDNSKHSSSRTQSDNIILAYNKAQFTDQNYIAKDKITLAIQQFSCSNANFIAREIHIDKSIETELTGCTFVGKIFKSSAEDLNAAVEKAEFELKTSLSDNPSIPNAWYDHFKKEEEEEEEELAANARKMDEERLKFQNMFTKQRAAFEDNTPGSAGYILNKMINDMEKYKTCSWLSRKDRVACKADIDKEEENLYDEQPPSSIEHAPNPVHSDDCYSPSECEHQ